MRRDFKTTQLRHHHLTLRSTASRGQSKLARPLFHLLITVAAVIVALLASPLQQRLRLSRSTLTTLLRFSPATQSQLPRTTTPTALITPSPPTTPRPLFTMPRSRGDPYNYLYERMLPFHANFRRTLAMLQHTLPQTQTLPKRDLERFLAVGVQLVQHLELHHNIEETHIFPVLATKMPIFGASAAHVHEHEVMHTALETFHTELLATHKRLVGSQGKKAEAEGCGKEGKEWPRAVYDGDKVKELIDMLAGALLPHLEAEERSISAKSMREAGWSEEEVLRIPI